MGSLIHLQALWLCEKLVTCSRKVFPSVYRDFYFRHFIGYSFVWVISCLHKMYLMFRSINHNFCTWMASFLYASIMHLQNIWYVNVLLWTLKVFSRVIKCVFRWLAGSTVPHTKQLIGFSQVWVLSCTLKLFKSEKVLSHCKQPKGFSTVWIPFSDAQSVTRISYKELTWSIEKKPLTVKVWHGFLSN